MNGEPLRRSVDKFANRTLGSLTPEELGELFEASSARGAYSALEHVGLNSEESVENLKDVLLSVKSYRKASKIVKMGIWVQMKSIFRIISWVISISFTIFLLKALLPPDEAAHLIKYIGHGG